MEQMDAIRAALLSNAQYARERARDRRLGRDERVMYFGFANGLEAALLVIRAAEILKGD